jgi:hypothetical protein
MSSKWLKQLTQLDNVTSSHVSISQDLLFIEL